MLDPVRRLRQDERAQPRVFAQLDVRYLRAQTGAPARSALRLPEGEHDDARHVATAAATWLAGGSVLGVSRTPDRDMSLSASGFAFDDQLHADEGDLLLVEFAIPGDTVRHRATARVCRVARIPIDERDDMIDATHRIACAFVGLPDGAFEALCVYTRRIQDRAK